MKYEEAFHIHIYIYMAVSILCASDIPAIETTGSRLYVPDQGIMVLHLFERMSKNNTFAGHVNDSCGSLYPCCCHAGVCERSLCFISYPHVSFTHNEDFVYQFNGDVQ